MTQPEREPWPDDVQAAHRLMDLCPTCQTYEQVQLHLCRLKEPDGMTQDRWLQAFSAIREAKVDHQRAKHPVFLAYMEQQYEKRRAAAAANE